MQTRSLPSGMQLGLLAVVVMCMGGFIMQRTHIQHLEARLQARASWGVGELARLEAKLAAGAPAPLWLPSTVQTPAWSPRHWTSKGGGGAPVWPKAVALPSVPATAEEAKGLAATQAATNVKYGGRGDKKHLGGFTKFDPDGVSPRAWRDMLANMTIKSVLDVGCGRGVSASWFHTHGARVLCVEGSHDATSHSHLPAEMVVEHDFSRGPWWPEQTFDAAWSVEFLEHVGRQHMLNYLPAFHQAALLFVTHSLWGGWHHVEVKPKQWWHYKMTAQGFIYSEELTEQIRKVARAGKEDNVVISGVKKQFRAQHIWSTMRVYINPAVARLPEHMHLIGQGEGCWRNPGPGEDKMFPETGILVSRAACTGEDVLPMQFKPLAEDIDPLDRKWHALVFNEREHVLNFGH